MNHPLCARRGLPALLVAAAACLAAGAAASRAAPRPVPASSQAPTVRLGPLADRPRSGGTVRLKLAAPTVRIGLTGDGRAVALESAGGLYVVDRQSGRDVWKHIHNGPLRVVLERGAVEVPPVFRVQVASLASREEADALKEKLEAETGEGVQVSRYPDRNAWRVRVGQRGSREEIAQVEERLRGLGYEEIWVVQEPGPGGRQPRMRLVDEDYNDLITSAQALLVLPAAEGRPVRVAGTAYRGVVEVVVTPSRELQAVNVLNVEEYLKGVVPKELGPTLYPELEALKAQTVAARTYVEANRGQFSEDGYDICDTARCQVYGGMEGEHPLSDFAVEQTAGIIATWQGRPINALYTATCGGHTEDLKNVFREMEGPYLRGVTCYPDEQTLAQSRRAIRGAWSGPPVVLPSGERIDEALAILEILGVVTPDQATASFMSSPAPAAEAGEWARRTLQAIGRRPPSPFPAAGDPLDLPALSTLLVQALEWEDRVELLVKPPDVPNFLGPALEAVPAAARPAVSYLVKEEILPRPRGAAGAGGTPGGEPVSRALVARALHRLVARYQGAGLRAAKHRGFRDQTIGLQADGEIVFHPLAARLHLVVKSDQESLAVSEHVLQDGDNLEFHLDRSGAVDCLVVKANIRGASDDRFTVHHTWETRMPRGDLETRVQARASIGRLQDVVAGRRGVSGRILDLTVVGSGGRFTFRGFDIVRLIGVRESLFSVERQFGSDGTVETFIFTGRGWGHGVGLCQVGAYGMALRGRTYEEILRHYYTGIELSPSR